MNHKIPHFLFSQEEHQCLLKIDSARTPGALISFRPGFLRNEENFHTLIGLSKEDFIRFRNGELNVTPELAKKLSFVLGTTEDFWLNAQKNFDEDVAKYASEIQTTSSEDDTVDPENYTPGSFGCHEVLHMSSFLMNAIDRELCQHPSIRNTPEWLQFATDAHNALANLYQKIGEVHADAMEDEEISRAVASDPDAAPIQTYFEKMVLCKPRFIAKKVYLRIREDGDALIG